MPQSSIALIIVILAVASFALEKLPAALTALLAMLAMYFSGVASAAEASSGFSSSGVLLVMAMMIIGYAFVKAGLANQLCAVISRAAGAGGRQQALLICLCGALLSFVINPAAVVAMLLPVTEEMQHKTRGRLQRKTVVMPLTIACSYSGLLNAASTSSMVTVGSLYEQSGAGRGFAYLEPFKIGIFALLLFFAFYAAVGYSWLCRRFPLEASEEYSAENRQAALNKKQAVIVLLTLLACMIAFACSSYNIAMIALAGAAVLIVSGCVSMKEAIAAVNWQTILIMSCCIGFAKGFEVSGAADLVAHFLIERMGPLGDSPFAMCCMVLALSTVLSNFMSNTAAAVTMVPLAFAVAAQLGAPLLPYALAVGVGVNLVCATPVCSPAFTMILPVGYRFNDFLTFGGVINLSCAVVCCAALKLFFFL